MTDWLMEHITGSKKVERMLYKNEAVSRDEEKKINESLTKLMQHEPLQYVINEAWFCGLRFYVDKNVLIPRPETEELVEWVLANVKFPFERLKILDIGSGSGCIPVALKRRLRKAEVWSCDISDDALLIARKNADALGTAVDFQQLDFLDAEQRKQLPVVDIIVSNPPYIPQDEKETLAQNVRDYEPSAALFVPDNDPLVFYRAIAEFGKTNLDTPGAIYCELHEGLADAVETEFRLKNYDTEMKRDMQGKQRFIKAIR
jgi:release factor glutamine methyltransferase